MFEDNYKILVFFKAMSIKGRKKIHKIIYLLQQLGFDFGCQYIYSHYGPYSPQLQMELDEASSQKFLQESFLNNTYEYSLTNEGFNFCNSLKEAEFVDEFEIPTELLRILNSKDTSLLELAATIVFVRESGYDPDRLYEKVKDLKPHLIKRYDEAMTLLNNIYKEYRQ